jgi:hypothetical protein
LERHCSWYSRSHREKLPTQACSVLAPLPNLTYSEVQEPWRDHRQPPVITARSRSQMVQSALAGAQAGPVRGRGGPHHHPGARRVRQPVVPHGQAAPWPHRQRHQEPLAFGTQADRLRGSARGFWRRRGPAAPAGRAAAGGPSRGAILWAGTAPGVSRQPGMEDFRYWEPWPPGTLCSTRCACRSAAAKPCCSSK